MLASVLALVCGAMALRLLVGWGDHAPGPVEPWMTPRYIVHAYHIPPEVLADLLRKRPGEGPHETLEQLAATRGVPVAALIATIEADLARHRQGAGGSHE